MRIIAGEFRHRVLEGPGDSEVTRPIPDRVKESLFALLRGHCEDAAVFDAFAGVGSIGLECLSRGAARVVMVEQDRRIADILRRNVEALGAADRCDVVTGDALGPGALARAPRPLHLAFFDPPYPLVQDPVGFMRVMAQVARAVALLDDTGFVVLRTPWPLVHTPGAVPAEPTASAPPPRRKKGPRGGWRQEMRRAALGMTPRVRPKPADHADEPPAEPDDDNAADAPDEAPNAAPPTVTPDLRLPGAVGPETHVYRGMALHLYMRDRGTS